MPEVAPEGMGCDPSQCAGGQQYACPSCWWPCGPCEMVGEPGEVGRCMASFLTDQGWWVQRFTHPNMPICPNVVALRAGAIETVSRPV